MNTNKYSLESRRKQANTFKFLGPLLIVIGIGMFLYFGYKMYFSMYFTSPGMYIPGSGQDVALRDYQNMIQQIFIILAAVGIITAIIGKVMWKKYKIISAGLYGEELVSYTLNSLPNEYTVYNNIPLGKDGKQTEIDTLVVSKYGIFLGEIKNYKGRISGNENDSTWTQTKTSSAGKSYENTIKNPVKQAKLQTHLLSSILKENKLNCYIHPYVVFLNTGNIYTDSELVLKSENEFHNTILSYHDIKISRDNLEKLKEVIACLIKSESWKVNGKKHHLEQ